MEKEEQTKLEKSAEELNELAKKLLEAVEEINKVLIVLKEEK